MAPLVPLVQCAPSDKQMITWVDHLKGGRLAVEAQDDLINKVNPPKVMTHRSTSAGRSCLKDTPTGGQKKPRSKFLTKTS